MSTVLDASTGYDGASRRPAPRRHSYDHQPPAAPAGQDAGGSGNPLVRAANHLIDLVPRIRELAQVENPAELRQQLVAEIRLFEQQALAARVPQEEVIGARYCLCTVLDESAAQTPWGGRGVWAKHSLLVTFHNETWGGEKYYQLLARLAQNPERHRNLIELLYFCNALGFEGRYRIVDNGQSQLDILRRRIATMLNNVRGGYETRLSPHWVGMAADEPTWRFIPPWVIATLCGLAACAIYFWLLFALGSRSDTVYADLAALRVPPTAVVEAPAPPVQSPRLRRFLEAEIRAGLVEVSDQADRSVVTLLGDGLFESGREEVKPRYLPVLARIASALAEVEGPVLVAGFTDNVPMRSPRFPSNWELSQARAESVKTLLDGFLGRTDRVRAEGRGEADPVAGNETAEGRARNRRVEVTLMLPAMEIHRQLNSAYGTGVVPQTVTP